MKYNGLNKDRRGREAFAYLAISLLLLSTLFISYLWSVEHERDEREQELSRVRELKASLDTTVSDLGHLVMEHHEALVERCEQKVLRASNGTRLYSALESELVGSLPDLIRGELSKRNGSDPSIRFYLEGLRTDCIPFTRDFPGPAPSTDEGDENVTGSLSTVNRTEPAGVNTTVSLQICARSEDGGAELRERKDIIIDRWSSADMLSERVERLGDSLTGSELERLVCDTISSLSQTKSTLGQGRVLGSRSEGAAGPVLTEEEVLSCIDLVVALLTRSYTGSSDREFLNTTSEALSEAPGAGGRIMDLFSMTSSSETPIDPSTAVLLAEGLFSEEDPPSLESMLRPLLLSLVNSMATRLFEYVGLDEEVYSAVGGMAEMFSIVKEGFDDLSETIAGRRLLGSANRTAREMVLSCLDRCPLELQDEGLLMARSFGPNATWNGAPIEGYPLFELPTMERTFEMDLANDSAASCYYRDGSGNIHTKLEYSDPEDVYFGHACHTYSVEVELDFLPAEPFFHPVDLLGSEGLMRSLCDLLGDGAGNWSSSAEELTALGTEALRKGIAELISLLSENGGELWDLIWEGWDPDSPPPLDMDRSCISFITDLNIGALPAVIRNLTRVVMGSLEGGGFLQGLRESNHALGSDIAGWLLSGYDAFTDKEEMLVGAEEAFLYRLFSNCTATVLSCELVDVNAVSSDVIFPLGGWDDTADVLGFQQNLIVLSLAIDGNGGGDIDFMSDLRSALRDSFDEVRDRDVGLGGIGTEPGIIRQALMDILPSNSTRGGVGELFAPTFEGLFERLDRTLTRTFRQFERDFLRPLIGLGGRCLLPPSDDGQGASGGPTTVAPGERGPAPNVTIERLSYERLSFAPGNGTHCLDPVSNSSPYVTDMLLAFSGWYRISARALSGPFGTVLELERTFPLGLDLCVEVATAWPLEGAGYEETDDMYDLFFDEVLEAKELVTSALTNGTEGFLGDTMGSLQEVPPLITDMIKGKDLDLAEITRVLSNVTMDLSKTLREAAKSLIEKLIEMGLSALLSWSLEIIGLDDLNFTLEIGPVNMGIGANSDALSGKPGRLANISIEVSAIGLLGHFGVVRGEGSEVKFNGTVIFRSGPLMVRMELDPFMRDVPHMVSVEGIYTRGNGEELRFGISCPALVEYRSAEISLGGALGIEPMVPIPPLGIQAVFDGGFRLRYNRPDELPPRINEVRFTNGNVTLLEVYDPRCFPIGGSLLEVRTVDRALIGSWRLEMPAKAYMLFALDSGKVWEWRGALKGQEKLWIVLRAPTGEIMDDVTADAGMDGWLSRDSDGFGVWRETGGTPGVENSSPAPMSLESLILSIIVSSLREAWDEAFELYGLSFDTVGHFLKRAIQFFIERFLSLVRELVVDVRVFLSIEVEDSSGTGGFGLEMSFLADGEAVASFLSWLYENIIVFIENLGSPQGAGSYPPFPMEVLEGCGVEMIVFLQVEMPVSMKGMAPAGAELPSSLTLGIAGGFNLAVPMKLLGRDIGAIRIWLGVFIVDAPSVIVGMFYDVTSIDATSDLYIVRAEVWEERGKVI